MYLLTALDKLCSILKLLFHKLTDWKINTYIDYWLMVINIFQWLSFISSIQFNEIYLLICLEVIWDIQM